jgi:hypothetical protein
MTSTTWYRIGLFFFGVGGELATSAYLHPHEAVPLRYMLPALFISGVAFGRYYSLARAQRSTI